MAGPPMPGKWINGSPPSGPPMPGKFVQPVDYNQTMTSPSGKQIPMEGVEDAGLFGGLGQIAGPVAVLLTGGGIPAAVGWAAFDLASNLASSGLPEEAPWYVRLPIEMVAGALSAKGVARLIEGKALPEATKVVEKALQEPLWEKLTPKALKAGTKEEVLNARLARGEPSPELRQLPALGETSPSRSGRIFEAGRGLEETLTQPAARSAYEPGTALPALAREPGLERTAGVYRFLPKELGRETAPMAAQAETYLAPSTKAVEGKYANVVREVTGPPGETGRFVRNVTPEPLPPPNIPSTESVIGMQGSKSLLERLASQSRQAARGEKYANRLGLGGRGTPPAPPEAAQAVTGDAAEEAKTGLGGLFSYLGSPILSELERTGGRTGEMLRALEGQKTFVQNKWLADYIQPLVDQLNSLSKGEKASFVAVTDKGLEPINSKVAQVVNNYYKVFGEQGVVPRALESAGLGQPPIKGPYYPHVFDLQDIKKILADPKRLGAAVKSLVNSGRAVNAQEAKILLQRYFKGKALGLDRQTGAEFERSGIPGYIVDDPARAIMMRGTALAQRLAEHQIYGPKDKIVRDLIFESGLQPEIMTRLNRLFGLTMRRDPIDEGLRATAQKLMTFNAITQLSLSGIVNLSQNSLLLLRTNLPNMIKAHLRFLAHPVESYQAARQLGLYADIAQKKLYAEMTGSPIQSRIAQESLRMFSFTEKIVRAVADEAGKDWAATVQKALSNPNNARWAQDELHRLNFLPENIARIMKTGTLTPQDVERVRASLVDQVAFLPRNARKSQFYLETAVGPALLQFKGFLMNTGRLLKQTVTDEWRRGDAYQRAKIIGKLGLVIPTLAAFGEIPADVSAAARGSRRPYAFTGDPSDLLGRAADNVSQLGALGIGFEVLRDALNLGAYGQATAGLIGGPSLNLLTEIGPRVGGIATATARGDTAEAERNAYELFRSGVRRVPYFGPALANLGVPSSSRRPLFSDEDVLDRLGLSDRSQTLARYHDTMRKLQHIQQQQKMGY